MDRELDVQRDHVELISMAMKKLAPGGLLLFSTNFRKFKLDGEALAGLEVKDFTKGSVPFDFARDPKVHACFEIRRP
jgi:23S rRNA (guanine2445-N2)-methyltransferase / 23S rRNA (guanine2069-N7)-methyltransferase